MEFELEEATELPSKTYRLDPDKGRIYGKIDGLEAVEQAIRKALITQRFCDLIYDDDYGCEAQDALHDKGVTQEFLETAIPEMVKDALSQDTRITNIYDFKLNFENDSAYISFKVDTIFGDTQIDVII